MGLGPALPIVVNNGIAAGTPFTVGDIALITGDTPPTLGDSILTQRTDGPVTYIAVGSSDIESGASETFRTSSGIISRGAAIRTIVMGKGASAAGQDDVALGDGASANGGGFGAVAIGYNAVALGAGVTIGALASVSNANSIAIGEGATVTSGTGAGIAIGGSAGKNSIGIGQNASAGDTANGRSTRVGMGGSGSGADTTVLGYGVIASAASTVAIGSSAQAQVAGGVAIGKTAVVDLGHTDSIALGHGAHTTAAQQLVIGGNGDSAGGITSILLGNLTAGGVPQAFTVGSATPTGSDVAGSNLTINAGGGTGAGTASMLVFGIPLKRASGTTAQNIRGALKIFETPSGTGKQVLVQFYASDNAADTEDGIRMQYFINNSYKAEFGAGLSYFTAGSNDVSVAGTSSSGQMWVGMGSQAVLRIVQNGVGIGAATPSLGGGNGVLYVANATTAPTSNPTGGGILYAVAGALVWRGSSGTVTTLAPA